MPELEARSSETGGSPRPAPVAGLRFAVERRLGELLPRTARPDGLENALRYALLAPGKRVRPLLTLLACRELGAEGLDALDAGCAIEMVHAASLVLDDMPCMDDAPTRRGAPSTHAAFGEEVAMLASIALLARAFQTVGADAGIDPSRKTRLVTILAEAVGQDGLAGGQLRDLRPLDAARSVDGIQDANHLKTGILFAACVEAAAVIAGVEGAPVDALRRFAIHLGQAFQLLDDLADGAAPDGGAPEDAGKATILSLVGRAETRRRLTLHLEEGLAALKADGDLAIFVRDLFAAART